MIVSRKRLHAILETMDVVSIGRPWDAYQARTSKFDQLNQRHWENLTNREQRQQWNFWDALEMWNMQPRNQKAIHLDMANPTFCNNLKYILYQKM